MTRSTVSRWAVRPDDLLQALLEVRPHVVHFSGHGSAAAELILLDDQGNPKPVSKEALVHLFRTLKDNVRVVVLNACCIPTPGRGPRPDHRLHHRHEPAHRRRGGHRLRRVVLPSPRLRSFGEGGLRAGQAALLLEGIPEEQTPELLTREGVDAAGLVLIPAGRGDAGASEARGEGTGGAAWRPGPPGPRARAERPGPRGLGDPRQPRLRGRRPTSAATVPSPSRWPNSSAGRRAPRGPDSRPSRRPPRNSETLNRPIATPRDGGGGPTLLERPLSGNPAFTGRRGHLADLRKRLTERGRGRLAQAISGLGGIGKTQTAVEYAYRYRDEYEAVLWLNAESRSP